MAFAWFVSGFLVHRPANLPPGVMPAAWVNADPRSLYDIQFERVEFVASDGIEAGAWLVRAPREQQQTSAVVFVHGRGGSRHLILGVLPELHAAGLGVLSIDARGHARPPSVATGPHSSRDGWTLLPP